MDTFYGMRTLKKLNREEFISAKTDISGINLTLYVINTASLRSQDEHHAPARIPLPPIQPLDVLNAVHNGLSEWKKGKNSKGKNKAPESMSSIDPSLA
ncbi:hypothetical protein PPACK8108_LOCUS6852 [Phakopsora pachyrhizi]|uniref:Uncharacterized protein n=1 Tax=Phakopsora pachyrhizi TaxID=170000 RepID=A0AAV0ATF6_PHAPC|nr:hypothetical protein PPACK8108_LOCUS6852 [Phakopsora pachyrhizi]